MLKRDFLKGQFSVAHIASGLVTLDDADAHGCGLFVAADLPASLSFLALVASLECYVNHAAECRRVGVGVERQPTGLTLTGCLISVTPRDHLAACRTFTDASGIAELSGLRMTTMNEYLFRIGDENSLCLYFKTIADSPEQAVDRANEAISEESPSSDVFIRSGLPDAAVYLHDEVRVDKSMIVAVVPVERQALDEARRVLEDHGYTYSSEEDEFVRDLSPNFTKPVYSEDGGIYAFFKVDAYFERNIEKYSFRLGAVLYPAGLARFADGDGGLHYGVHFQDKQAFTTADELAMILPLYESKFHGLMQALRKADPVDGLPLVEEADED